MLFCCYRFAVMTGILGLAKLALEIWKRRFLSTASPYLVAHRIFRPDSSKNLQKLSQMFKCMCLVCVLEVGLDVKFKLIAISSMAL